MVKVGDGSSIHMLMMLLQVILVASVIGVSEGSIFKRPKRHVHIVNSLEMDRTLKVECKSESGDDLGMHDVFYGDEYQFEFYPNIFGTTMFVCNLQWPGRAELVTVYNAKTSDFERCVKDCYWKVELNQICTWGDAGPSQQVCTPWK